MGHGVAAAWKGSRRTMDKITWLFCVGLTVARTSRTPRDAARTGSARTRSSMEVPRRSPNPTRSPLGVGVTMPTIGGRSERVPGREANVAFRCRRTLARCSMRASRRRRGGGITARRTDRRSGEYQCELGAELRIQPGIEDRGQSQQDQLDPPDDHRSQEKLENLEGHRRCLLRGGVLGHGVLLSGTDEWGVD
jgi:hypothetical protein